MSISSSHDTNVNDTAANRQSAMLRAIRGQMNGENGRKMDIVLKMMEARRLAAKIR